MSGSLQRMQAKRLAFPNQRIFADEAEAMAWLTGGEDATWEDPA